MGKLQTDSLWLPLIKSGLIHLLMFLLLLTSFHVSKVEEVLEIQVKSAPVIKATAISSAAVEQLVKNKQQKINAAAKAERDRKARIRRAAEKKKKAAADKKRKKAADKKRKADAEKKRKKTAADKTAADKKKKADADKKKKADAEKKRKADEEKRRQQKIADDLRAKQEAAANAAKEQRILTELQKYVVLIKNKISRNWIIGNQTGKCILEVKLAPGGLVLGIRELGGVSAICRSAKAAVYKADPLPVSKDPDVFKKMRTLRLDLDPQEL